MTQEAQHQHVWQGLATAAGLSALLWTVIGLVAAVVIGA